MKKISDLPKFKYCRHPEHNPPGMIVLQLEQWHREAAEKVATTIFSDPIVSTIDYLAQLIANAMPAATTKRWKKAAKSLD